MTEQAITRAEFQMLADRVTANSQQMGNTAALAVQITEVIKDVNEVKDDLRGFRRDHESQHRAEASARVTSRRWAITALIAVWMALEGPIAYLIVHIR